MSQALHSLDYLDTLMRIGLAVLLGGLIGIEREIDAQPAGFRTHVLVTLGATMFTIAGYTVPGADPARVAAQVASGIGFIGAGAILRDAGRIRGLTTAGSLWGAAAIGVSVGFGLYAAAATATVVVLAVLYLLKAYGRGLFRRSHDRQLVVFTSPRVQVPDAVAAVSRVTGSAYVTRVSSTEDRGVAIAMRVPVHAHEDFADVAQRLLLLDQIDGVELRR